VGLRLTKKVVRITDVQAETEISKLLQHIM